jgi:hypothetical protein
MFSLPDFFYLRFFFQFSMTKGTGPSLLDQDFFHHLDQFAIVKNLFDNMGMGLSIILAVRKTAFPTHILTPSNYL